ncbi:MAG: FAD-binding protein [Alphaproteobacteria bacterium]|nr:FAD-binding protein [Alphaproteobacteria bacterium]
MTQFSRAIAKNRPLDDKHLFKKRAGAAAKYYQLQFDDSLQNDLQALHEMYKRGEPFRIYGAHTNLYICDNGYGGLFVDISPKHSKIDEAFAAPANATVSELVNKGAAAGYDFSALAGIPGMIGSGVAGNSGYSPSGKAFGDFVAGITAYDFETGRAMEFAPDENFFAARDSFIKRANSERFRYFITEVKFKADFIGPVAAREKVAAQMAKRKTHLATAFEEGSAGSLWNNEKLRRETGNSFAIMLRENGALNADFNGATYSANGANFFITTAATTDNDVAKLFAHSISKAHELYGAELEKEIATLDTDGEIDLATFITRNS